MQKIKLVIFDLDGVLVSTKKIHYQALNEALEQIDPKYIITSEEHLSIYDGLKTNQKLELLHQHKGLDASFYEQIWKHKQQITTKLLGTISADPHLYDVLWSLKEKNIKIACCSNCIQNTLYGILIQLGIFRLFDLILSNEDVDRSKPHPEIYWRTMMHFGISSSETLIIEDSPNGLIAAYESGANVWRVDNPSDITIQNINKQLKIQYNIIKWKSDKLNILIPMAGAGKRFVDAGYELPKPLIDVQGEPMIKKVIDSLNIQANYIFLVQADHLKYNLKTILNLIVPGCQIITVDGLTDGAACTTLLAKELINNNNPLLICNSDQLIKWNSTDFMYMMNESELDGGILTFTSDDPKYSYAKISDGFVSEVAEKKVISNDATVGVYWWRYGSDYVKYAEQMINQNIKTNNEFYVCPVYNETIGDGKKIKSFAVQMIGLGTPEDLKLYNDSNCHP